MRIFQLLTALSCLSFSTPLEIWIMPNGASPQKVMGDLLDKFKSETGIDYRLKILDWGEAWGRVHDVLERKEGPHIIQMGTTWLPYFSSRNWLAPQAKKRSRILKSFSQWKSRNLYV